MITLLTTLLSFLAGGLPKHAPGRKAHVLGLVSGVEVEGDLRLHSTSPRTLRG